MSQSTLSKEMGEKWIRGLRSGKYSQTTGRLKRGDKYCCLGIFAICNGMEIDTTGEEIVENGINCSYIPLKNYLGEHLDRLWRMNDREERSFKEIADWIEENIQFV